MTEQATTETMVADIVGTDYDPATQTVLGDDGERFPVWDCDLCPRCGKGLIFTAAEWLGHPDDRDDWLICRSWGCEFAVSRDISQRPNVMPSSPVPSTGAAGLEGEG